jgi:hypothetical protein
MKNPSTYRLALQAAIALAILALAGCGSSAPIASNPTTSPAAAAKAPCTETAVLVSIRAKYDSAKTKVTLPSNADLVCAGGYAKITIFVAVVPTPASGPQGAVHLVLLEDQSSQWVIANQLLCNSSGQPVKPLPAKLGPVCGIQ